MNPKENKSSKAIPAVIATLSIGIVVSIWLFVMAVVNLKAKNDNQQEVIDDLKKELIILRQVARDSTKMIVSPDEKFETVILEDKMIIHKLNK